MKRALLTAYADTDAAINAINSVQIDYYLMKPWDPPEGGSTRSSTTCSRTGWRRFILPLRASASLA